jgi:hypothetical protein
MKVFVNICFTVIAKDKKEAESLRYNQKMTPEAWLKLREQQVPNFPDVDWITTRTNLLD